MRFIGNDYYKSIDGNPIRKPVGYCAYHRGYVSERQAKVHRCYKKYGGTCGRMHDLDGRRVKTVKQDAFYDKTIDRMDKMIVALNKLAKALEAMQKVEFNKAMTISVTDKNGNPVVLHKHAEDRSE